MSSNVKIQQKSQTVARDGRWVDMAESYAEDKRADSSRLVHDV